MSQCRQYCSENKATRNHDQPMSEIRPVHIAKRCRISLVRFDHIGDEDCTYSLYNRKPVVSGGMSTIAEEGNNQRKNSGSKEHDQSFNPF